MPVSRHEFCCGCLPIFSGIFAIVLHSFIHSIYAFCLILTSYYQPKDSVINYVTLSGYICLVVIGVPILWVVVLQQIRGIKVFGVLFLLITLYNLACGIAYFVVYFPYKANSLLDKVFLWRYGTKWVTSEKLPFAIWHLLTGLLIAVTPLWFYYTYIILIYPAYLKLLETEEANAPEIIVLENRLGPFGAYRPPQGYPYSTNQRPSAEGQYASLYNPYYRPQDRRADANPTAVLD